MDVREEIRCGLRRLALCIDLTPEALAAVERASALRVLLRGEVLARAGEAPRAVFGVCRGFVRAEHVAQEGQRRLVDVYGPGDAIGLTSLLQRTPAPHDLRAQEPACVLRIERRALDACPDLQLNAARLLASEYMRAREQLRAQSLQSSEAALAFRLSTLVARHGVPHPDGGRVLPFRLAEKDLGESVGLPAERVARLLREWRQRGWLALIGGQLLVRDVHALAERGRRPAPRPPVVAPPPQLDLALAI